MVPRTASPVAITATCPGPRGPGLALFRTIGRTAPFGQSLLTYAQARTAGGSLGCTGADPQPATEPRVPTAFNSSVLVDDDPPNGAALAGSAPCPRAAEGVRTAAATTATAAFTGNLVVARALRGNETRGRAFLARARRLAVRGIGFRSARVADPLGTGVATRTSGRLPSPVSRRSDVAAAREGGPVVLNRLGSTA